MKERVCQLFEVFQHEFANLSLPCEGRLKVDRNTEYMFSISFRKHRDEKKENNLLTLIIKMQILFSRAIAASTAGASSVFPSSYTNTIFNQSASVVFWDCFLMPYIHYTLLEV